MGPSLLTLPVNRIYTIFKHILLITFLNEPDSVSVSLFNGISTFVGYLMSKLFSEKNSSGTI